MKSIIILCGLFIGSAQLVAQDIAGEWKGAYVLNAEVKRFNVYILPNDNGHELKLDVIDSKNSYDLAYELKFEGDSLNFSRTNSNGILIEYKGTLSEAKISGIKIIHHEFYKDKPGMFQMMKSNAQLVKGQQMPDFQLSTLKGIQIQNTNFQNKYYILDFWATWCAPCVAKRPKLTALKEKLGDRLEIISVSLDDSNEIVTAFRKDKYAMPWLNVLKSEKWDDEFIKKYVSEGLPYGYLINPEGKILAFGKELDAENFEKTIERVIQ